MKHLCFDLECDGDRRDATSDVGLADEPSIVNDKSIVNPLCEAVYDLRFQKHLAKLSAKKDAGIKITKADLWYA